MKPKFICAVCGGELESEVHTVRVFEPEPAMVVVVNIQPCKGCLTMRAADLACTHRNTEAVDDTIVCKDCGNWL